MIRFTVFGDPVAQGSMIARMNHKTGTPYVVATNDGKLRPWRKKVALAAEAAHLGRELLDRSLAIGITFFRNPPAKRAAETYDLTGKDLDKLCRAIFDSVTGTIVTNDARFVQLQASKQFTDGEPRVEIFITEINE